MSARQRDPFADCAAAQRQAFERATAAGASDLQIRTLFVVCNLTAGWSKFQDASSARQIAALVYGVSAEAVSGGQRRRVRYALQWLAARKVIGLEGARGGPLAGVVVALPRANVPPAEHVDDVDGQTQRAPETHSTCSGDDNNVLSTRGNTEDLPEKSSEERDRSLVDELARRNRTAARVEWEALIARWRTDGVDDPTIAGLVEHGLREGKCWPSQFDKLSPKTPAGGEPQKPRDHCPACVGEGGHEIEEGGRRAWLRCSTCGGSGKVDRKNAASALDVAWMGQGTAELQGVER